MKIELDNETKVIAILSGYVRELKEGKDYLETTYKTAETVVKICSIPDVSGRSEQLSDFLNWYRNTNYNCEGHSDEDVVNEYLKIT
jgi:phage major head subunit gpT-like protein